MVLIECSAPKTTGGPVEPRVGASGAVPATPAPPPVFPSTTTSFFRSTEPFFFWCSPQIFKGESPYDFSKKEIYFRSRRSKLFTTTNANW